MKIQSTAIIHSLSIGGSSISLPKQQKIEIEFSAIDTGGGFKDPILDFSFELDTKLLPKEDIKDQTPMVVTLCDPRDEKNTAQFEYEPDLVENIGDDVEINGRLKEDQLQRELIGFVLRHLR